MFESLRQRQPGHSLARIAWWYMLWSFCYVWMNVCYRYRAFGVRDIPVTGPVMFVSNHQSTLDPIIVGVAAHRRQFYAMARHTLWKNPLFGKLIDSMNAIPVERNTADMTAMRKSIDVLKQGHALLIFPEGTRTLDGTVKTFAPGTMLLIKRAKPMVVPVAIEGSYDVYPKGRTLPKLFGRIRVRFGDPVAAEELVAMGAEEGLLRLQNEIEAMRQGLAARR